MDKKDFYLQVGRDFNTLLHIRSSVVLKLNKDTDIDLYFRQLILGEKIFNRDSFISFGKSILNKFEFLKLNHDFPNVLNNISMQSIMLPISGGCNLKCTYCFAQTEGNFGFKDISPDKATEIIDFVLGNNNQKEICAINFFGGEPMLNMNCIESTIKYVKRKYPDRKVIYGITTNGTLFNKKTITTIKEHGIKLLVSYDGPTQLAPHRKFFNGKPSNDKVIANIIKLKEEGCDIQLRATISSDCNNLKDIYDYFESLNIPYAAVLAYKSRNIDSTCIYNDKKELFVKYYEDLLDYYTNRINSGKKINCYSIANDLYTIKHCKINNLGCTGGINIFAITDSGDVFSCEHLAFDSKYAIGSIKMGLDESKLKLMQPDNVDTISNCKNCWIRYYCKGGCFSEKILNNRHHSSLTEDECEIKKIYWNFILSLYVVMEQQNTNVNSNNRRECN